MHRACGHVIEPKGFRIFLEIYVASEPDSFKEAAHPLLWFDFLKTTAKYNFGDSIQAFIIP